jgi:quercetin 2,3-dioxygenase
MSTLDQDLDALAQPVTAHRLELTDARQARVGDLTVRRLLPLRRRRSVGAWCFIDHYGPTSVDGVTGMAVPPHPHIGLQTVTWLLAGNVLHRDSLGSEQMIRPGQLNLMTSGRGIAHAEESPLEHDPQLHGVQLWVALPEASRLTEPAFEHHTQLPFHQAGGLRITVFIGGLADQDGQDSQGRLGGQGGLGGLGGQGRRGGSRSPATTFSRLVGAEMSAQRNVDLRLALDPDFEHVIFVASGAAHIAGTDLRPGQLLYVPTGRDGVQVAAPDGSTLLLLGGEPLGERLLMWWNFVARTPEEIQAAVDDWDAGRFGEVGGYAGAPLKAPPLRADLLTRPPGKPANPEEKSN